MNEKNSSRETDLDRLSRLKALSWLSPSELKLLASALSLTNYKRHALILRDVSLAQGAHILISGIARITCRTARNQRVTVALLAPGPIPDFPALPLNQSGFQCEAYNDCRVGTVSWADFGGITPNAPDSAFRQFHSNDLKQWYRLLLRSSSFMNLGLHERIAIALLELCSDFGVEESRGTLLRVAFNHKDIANLVGAIQSAHNAQAGGKVSRATSADRVHVSAPWYIAMNAGHSAGTRGTSLGVPSRN